MSGLMNDDTTLDAIAERIFNEVSGDRMRAWELSRNYLGYRREDAADAAVRAIEAKVEQKFKAFEEATAERIYAEAAGDRDRSWPLLREFKGTGYLFHIDRIVGQKFIDADNAAAQAIADRCHREADGVRQLGYALVEAYAGTKTYGLPANVRNRLKTMFVADTIERIGNSHPFDGMPTLFPEVDGEGRERFYNVGIEADGRLINPSNYPEDQLRAALRAAAAREIEKRKEASARAVKTREQRHTKLIYSIANGINNGKKYGPTSACVCCRKALTDPISVDRGVGPECWDRILRTIEHIKDRSGEPGLQRYGLSVGAPERG